MPTIDPETLNSTLGGVLAGKGNAIIASSQKYGIDPALLAAISIHETGNGTSKAVLDYNNPGGIMDWDNNWKTLRKFKTIDDGIDFMAKNLKRQFYDEGLTTVDQIAPKYAPVGATNDPRGLNKDWRGGVGKFYQNLVDASNDRTAKRLKLARLVE